MSVQQTGKRWFNVWAILLSVVVLAALTVAALTFWPRHWAFESAANLERIRTELPRARALWESKGITDYDIDVTGGIPLLCIVGTSTMHVRDGKFQPDSQSECSLRLSQWLVPDGFTALEQELETFNPNTNYLNVKFDPEYGFISEYEVDCNSNSVGDCYVHITLTNFKPIK